MRQTIIGLISLLILSCTNNCILPEEINSGEIISNAEIINSDYGCNNENLIIQNDSSNICELEVSFGNSDASSIDFSLYTVLSNPADGQCNVSMDKNVTRDDANKNVHYKLTVHECGNCESLLFSKNYVLVSKIPDDYSVTNSTDYNR